LGAQLLNDAPERKISFFLDISVAEIFEIITAAIVGCHLSINRPHLASCQVVLWNSFTLAGFCCAYNYNIVF